MRKIFYVIATFAICTLFGEGRLWLWFAVPFIMFTLKNADSSILWEIPMGVLIGSLAAEIFSDSTVVLLRILIPISAVLFAGFSPRRLLLFFPLAIVSLILRDGYGVAIMCASIWCGVRCIFIKDNSTTKKYLLQGNNLTMLK